MISRRGLLRGLLAAAVVAPLAALPNTEAEAQTVRMAPPPPRRQSRPPPRRGYVWINGHWAWRGGRYVWISGRWVRARPGWHYVPPRWVRRGNGWVFIPGGWRRW